MLACGGFLPPCLRARGFPGGRVGRRAGAVPQHPRCQLGHCGHTPLLPDSPVWLSCAQSRRSCRFSPTLVPHEAVKGGVLHASLAQSCCFNLGREEAPRPEEGGEGVHGICACGVMENFAVRPSLPWAPALGPACVHVPTSDTPLMAKIGQAETSCWGWGERRATPYPACAGSWQGSC